MDRYLAGNMSDEDRAEFEAWIVSNPDAASELQIDRQLRRGMLLAHKRGLLAGSLAIRSDERRAPMRMMLAASVAAIATIGGFSWLAGEREGLRQASLESTVSQASTSSEVVSLARYRGNQAPDIEYPVIAVPDHLVLQPDVVTLTCEDGSLALDCPDGLPPSLPQYAQYELEIVKRVGNKPVWRSDLQQFVPQSPLTFVIRARDLEAGDYDLLVRGSSATHQEVVGRYWLRILPGI